MGLILIFNFVILWVSGFQENNSLGMFFVVVVVAGGCRGYLGIGFLFLFGF